MVYILSLCNKAYATWIRKLQCGYTGTLSQLHVTRNENVSTPKTMVSVNAAESQRLLRNNQILQVAYQNDRKDC